MSRDVTLGVPTYQRPAFLARKLLHLEQQRFVGTVLVVDSSQGEHLDRNRETIERHRESSFRLRYETCPPTETFTAKITKAITASVTPYTAVTADDDFLFMDAIRAGAAALDRNKRFVSADGHILAYPLSRNGSPRNVPVLSKGDAFEALSPVERIHSLLASNRKRNPLFHLWRTDVLRRIWQPISHLSWTKYVEILFDNMATIAGPTKFIDQVFEMRHVDYSKSTYRSHGLSRFTDGFEYDLLDPQFAPTFKRCLEISQRTLEEAGLGEEEARKLFADAFIVLRLEAARVKLPINAPTTTKPGYEILQRRIRSLLGEFVRALKSPSRPFLIARLARIYTHKRLGTMLRYDPELRFNQITLSRLDTADGRAYRIAADLASKFPEIK